MLYNYSIFTKSGVVLYSKENQRIENNPLNYLVKEVLIKQRGDTKFLITNDNLYIIRWIFDNNNGLIFVAIYPKQFGAPYIDDLLNLTRKQFCDLYIKDNKKLDCFDDFSQFEETFNHTFKKLFELHSSSKPQKGNNLQENAENQQRNINLIIDNNNNNNNINNENNNNDSISPLNSPSELRSVSQEKVKRKPQHSHGKKSGGGGGKATPPPKKRVWGDKVSAEEQRELDRSRPNDNNSPLRLDSPTIDKINLDEEINSDDDDFKNELREATEKKGKKGGGFFSKYLPSLSGRALTEEDLIPVMEELRSHLTSKNVALEISEKLCESVKHSLEGQTLPSFTSVKTKVKEAMTNSIVRILTPNREIDVLREVQNVNARGKPYSIVFVGVNGVGKSTSLSKVCAWLTQHGLKVMVAACDTFRSGAVEQLKVHTDRLKVPLYQQGYGKDPSSIAAAAINQAQKEGINVVLIDTAGRMQDNEPLMKSLSSLVHANDPDLVLFVGEALVGNDGVHQLNSFNDLLESLAASLHPGSMRKKDKVIDGVFLTKYDTIDDKVGAALSMVYSTGIPILFVGVGQHYTDVKKMNPESVVKLLMA